MRLLLSRCSKGLVVLSIALLSACATPPPPPPTEPISAEAIVSEAERVEPGQKPVPSESLSKNQPPDAEKLALLKALDAAKAGHLSASEALLTAMIKDYPSSAAAYINLGILYYQQNIPCRLSLPSGLYLL